MLVQRATTRECEQLFHRDVQRHGHSELDRHGRYIKRHERLYAEMVLLQSPAGKTGSAAFSFTLTSTVAGESIFGMVYCAAANITSTAITDNQSNTYVRDVSGTSSEGVGVWSCLNPTPGVTSVTFTPPGGGTIIIGFCGTFSGVYPSGGFDKSSYLSNGAGGTYTSNATPTLSQAQELCIGMAGTGQSNNNSIAASGSWINPVVHFPNTPDGDDARWQYMFVNATTAVAATGTHTSVTRFHSICATYRAAFLPPLLHNTGPNAFLRM